MNRIFFDSLPEAIAYAKRCGGFIANCEDGSVQWFDAAKWTFTPIFNAIRCSAEVGPWTFFSNEKFPAP